MKRDFTVLCEETDLIEGLKKEFGKENIIYLDSKLKRLFSNKFSYVLANQKNQVNFHTENKTIDPYLFQIPLSDSNMPYFPFSYEDVKPRTEVILEDNSDEYIDEIAKKFNEIANQINL